MTSITSNGRLNTPSPRPGPSKSPVPRAPSRISPPRASSRAHNRARNDPVSGSETEREWGAAYSPDDLSSPPTASSTHFRHDDRYGDDDDGDVRAQETPSRTYTRSPRTSLTSGSISRRRGNNVLVPRSPEAHLFTEAINAVANEPPASVRRSPHRMRNPLPREFRGDTSLDGNVGRFSLPRFRSTALTLCLLAVEVSTPLCLSISTTVERAIARLSSISCGQPSCFPSLRKQARLSRQ